MPHIKICVILADSMFFPHFMFCIGALEVFVEASFRKVSESNTFPFFNLNTLDLFCFVLGLL